MSWLFGNGEFNEIIEKATSEMIPAGQEDISLFLEICDRIRSKEVSAKEAMRSLKKRLSHKNPNVQLLSLKLTDVCVKNGGSLFLAEIASREFMDALVQIVNSQSTNVEVKNKILSHIQSWANAFKSKPNLSYAVDTFNALKSQGQQFPALSTKTDAIMIDTQQAPDWTDSDVCERCRSLFTLTNRKHHCRNCGKTFCNQCSRNNIPLPHFGINNEVRVCDGCFAKVTGKSLEASTPVSTTLPSSLLTGNSSVSTQQQQQEDEELQRAIALSILESEKQGKSFKELPKAEKKKARTSTNEDEETDPELAAAIAASLREVELKESARASPQPQVKKEKESMYPSVASSSKSIPTAQTVDYYPSSQPLLTQHQQQQPKSGIDMIETQNISRFQRLMENMDADPSGASAANILADRELKSLHEQMTQIHPKLVKEIEECVEKHKTMMDLHEKLTSAVRIFDRLYEEKLYQQRQQQQQQQQHSYSQPSYGGYGGGVQPYYPPPSQQSYAAAAHPLPPSQQSYSSAVAHPLPPSHSPSPNQYYGQPPPQSSANYSAFPQGYPAPGGSYPQSQMPQPAPAAYPYAQPQPIANPPAQQPSQPQQQQQETPQKPLIEF